MDHPHPRQQLASAGVTFAAYMGGLGLLISFYPGSEAVWFGTAALVAAIAGVAAPGLRLRLSGVALAAVFAGMAWLGHERGVAYAQFLQERAAELPYSPAHPHGSRTP